MADAVPRPQAQPPTETDLLSRRKLHTLARQKGVSRGISRNVIVGNELASRPIRLNLGKVVIETEPKRM